MTRLLCGVVLLGLLTSTAATSATEPAEVIPLWPGTPPGDEDLTLPEESNSTKPDDKPIAGRPIIKLANVSTPTIAVYPAPADKATGTAIVVAPGGGQTILAYDLEGTEVAEWLNSIGVTAFVLKYRVPFRNPDRRWFAAVQDAERSIGIIRSRAKDWGIDPRRVGMLGFSAGGSTAAMTCVYGEERQYQPVDAVDQVPCRPDFACLIYPGGLVEQEASKLFDFVKVDKNTPPMFFVQAFDDRVPVQNSLLLFLKLKQAGVQSELHVFDRGGHGYGLRETDDPVTRWPALCETWLRTTGRLDKK